VAGALGVAAGADAEGAGAEADGAGAGPFAGSSLEAVAAQTSASKPAPDTQRDRLIRV
jgi:hypothetical protein